MTTQPSAGPGSIDLDLDSRAFDYGVGDDLRTAQQEVRAEIASRIREAARLDRRATPGERRVYEAAARLAEGGGSFSAQKPRGGLG